MDEDAIREAGCVGWMVVRIKDTGDISKVGRGQIFDTAEEADEQLRAAVERSKDDSELLVVGLVPLESKES